LRPEEIKRPEENERQDDEFRFHGLGKCIASRFGGVLKYPFCTGEAEQMVLNELERKTGRKFGGDVWKLVEQADALNIKDIKNPTQRPSALDALKELDTLSK
jgi:hypothetical protein